MPKSALEVDIEKATSELNVAEDWQAFMDICDRIKSLPNGPKDGLKFIMKRVNHQIPHVSLQALVLLSTCVTNCGKSFHLEVCSRDWCQSAKSVITRSHEKVSMKLRELIKQWAEVEFKDDSQLALMDQFYKKLKQDGFSFDFSSDGKLSAALASSLVSGPSSSATQQNDELNFKEDLDLAIAMSLQDAESNQGQRSSGSSNNTNSSLYPSFSSSAPSSQEEKELFQVRALYDFEAAEDNEMTFKNGDIFAVLDNGDENWWKGKNQLGVGLFPANFVTTELRVAEKSEKKVRFADSENVEEDLYAQIQPREQIVQQKVIEPKTVITEDHLDLTLSMLKNASPNEIDDEEVTIISMEDGSKEMGLLIEKKILNHDRRKDDLNDLNNKFLQALTMYQQLMKEPMVVQPPPQQQLQQQQQMTSHQQSLQYQTQPAYNYPPFYSLQHPVQQQQQQPYPSIPQYTAVDPYQQQQQQQQTSRQPMSMDSTYYNQQGPTSLPQVQQQSAAVATPVAQQAMQLNYHQQQQQQQPQPPPQSIQPPASQAFNSQQQIPPQQPQQQQQISSSEYQGYLPQQQQQQQYNTEQFFNTQQQQYPTASDYPSYDYNIPQNTQAYHQQTVFQ